MDFARAKIHSLVALAMSNEEGEVEEMDPEVMKFKEVEERFLKQFNMPEEEKLVNCKFLDRYDFEALLTLGAHAQRGLQYSVCLSVSLLPH